MRSREDCFVRSKHSPLRLEDVDRLEETEKYIVLTVEGKWVALEVVGI